MIARSCTCYYAMEYAQATMYHVSLLHVRKVCAYYVRGKTQRRGVKRRELVRALKCKLRQGALRGGFLFIVPSAHRGSHYSRELNSRPHSFYRGFRFKRNTQGGCSIPRRHPASRPIFIYSRTDTVCDQTLNEIVTQSLGRNTPSSSAEVTDNDDKEERVIVTIIPGFAKNALTGPSFVVLVIRMVRITCQRAA